MKKENDSLKGQVIFGLFWKFGERIIAQGISFIISLVLARLLLPEEYGLIALVLVFINIANVLVSDGLGASLIQKKEATRLDFSTMFYCSLFFASILYAVLFIGAPFIAKFYENRELIPVIRVLSLQVPLSAIKSIQHAYVSRNMLFKKFFWSTLGGTIISGVIGIIMAYHGFGVWALVEQYLVNSIIDMIVLFITVSWRPYFEFSFESARGLLGYSWKLLAASFINTIYNECRSLIIGKIYTEEDLAFNNKGNQFPSLIINNLNTAISSVLFPVMSKVGDDALRLKEMTRRSMKITSYVIFPLMFGLIAIADTLIQVLLTDKWLGCVPFLQIACIYWMFQPCLTANNQALKAAGRSDLCLKLEVVKKTIGFILVIVTMRISVYALAVSNAVFALISAIINIIPTRRVIMYGYKEQIIDLLPALGISATMSVLVIFVGRIPLPTTISLVIQLMIGIIVYILLSKLFKIDSYLYIHDIATSFFNNKE